MLLFRGSRSVFDVNQGLDDTNRAIIPEILLLLVFTTAKDISHQFLPNMVAPYFD